MPGRELIKKFIQSEPYYREKLAEIVQKRDRGEEVTETLDPLKQLMSKREDEKNLLVAPEDLSIQALFMSGVDESVTEKDIR